MCLSKPSGSLGSVFILGIGGDDNGAVPLCAELETGRSGLDELKPGR